MNEKKLHNGEGLNGEIIDVGTGFTPSPTNNMLNLRTNKGGDDDYGQIYRNILVIYVTCRRNVKHEQQKEVRGTKSGRGTKGKEEGGC